MPATRFTLGALFLTAFSNPVVPMIAGSSRSFLVSVTLKWNGEEVWITVSNGGSDTTALSNAPSCAMSSTITKSSLSFPTPGCASLIAFAFSWDRTLVTTECPRSSRTSRTCAAINPEPPVNCD